MNIKNLHRRAVPPRRAQQFSPGRRKAR
jgi:hypothetical protein